MKPTSLKTLRIWIIGQFVMALFSVSNANAQGGPPPNEDPCPPNTAIEEYCFTNSTQRYLHNCSLIICLKPIPTAAYSEICDVIPNFDSTELCVVLAPGEKKCISLPVFSLPASTWFDVDFTVRTIGVAAVTQLDAITYPEGPYTLASPKCDNMPMGHFTVVSDDGFDFIFHFMLIPGFGG